MNKLLGFVLSEGLSVVARNQIRKSVRKLTGLVVYYAIVMLLGLAALAFLYVLIYDWLSRLTGPQSAAAILCGSNLLIVFLMLVIRKIVTGKTAKRPPSPALLASLAANPAMVDPALAAGVEIGREIRARLRKATPGIVLAAAAIGLIVGLRPRIVTGLFRAKSNARPPAAKDRKPG
jgi:hypothetical protein